jgi:hypothetical protein
MAEPAQTVVRQVRRSLIDHLSGRGQVAGGQLGLSQ